MDKLFAVLGMLGNVGNDLVFKRVADMEEGTHTNLFYTVQALVIVPLCALGLMIFHPAGLRHGPSLLFGAPVGILTYLTYSLILHSLVASDPSINVTVYRLNFALTSVVAVLLLGETLTARKILGLVLCLAAILVFFFSTRTSRGVPVRGLPYSLAALASAAALNLLIKVAMARGADVLPLILYRYVTVAVIGLAVAGTRRLRAGQRGRPLPRPGRPLYLAALAGGVIMLGALYCLFTALQTGQLSIVIPISQLAFVFTAVAGKLAGIALAVASILVIG